MKQCRSRATRADDERVLDILHLRDKGLDSVQIGALVGMPANMVRTTWARVERDYLESRA